MGSEDSSREQAVSPAKSGADGKAPRRTAYGSSRTYAFLLAIACALAVSLTFYSWWREYREAREYWKARISGVADDRAHGVSTWLAERTADVRVVAGLPTTLHLLSSSSRSLATSQDLRTHLSIVITRVREAHDHVGLYVLDRKNRLVAQAEGSPNLAPRTLELSRQAMVEGASRVQLLGDEPAKAKVAFITHVLAEPERPAATAGSSADSGNKARECFQAAETFDWVHRDCLKIGYCLVG